MSKITDHFQSKNDLEKRLEKEKIEFIQEIEPLTLLEYFLEKKPDKTQKEVIEKLNISLPSPIINFMLYHTCVETNFFRNISDRKVILDMENLNTFIKLGQYIYETSLEDSVDENGKKWGLDIDLDNPNFDDLHDLHELFIETELNKVFQR